MRLTAVTDPIAEQFKGSASQYIAQILSVMTLNPIRGWVDIMLMRGGHYLMAQLPRGGTLKPDNDINKQREASKQQGRGESSKGELVPPGSQD
jgi:hypothetical protein